jgi:hypothetical protein
MSTAPAPKETLPFTPEQKKVAGSVWSQCRILAVMLFLFALICGLRAFMGFLEGNVFGAFLFLIEAALTGFLGLVIMACATDFFYLYQVPQFSGNHLRNVAKNLKVFFQVQIGLALLLALAVVLRIFV